MRDIMDRFLGDLEPGNDLPINVNGDRSFQEMFSNLPCSFRKIMAAVPLVNPEESMSVIGILSLVV